MMLGSGFLASGFWASSSPKGKEGLIWPRILIDRACEELDYLNWTTYLLEFIHG